MKLLMLLPNLVLMAISGINLYNESLLPGANLAVMVLHMAVFAICAVFVCLIAKSMFMVKYPQTEQKLDNPEPKVIRLQHIA